MKWLLISNIELPVIGYSNQWNSFSSINKKINGHPIGSNKGKKIKRQTVFVWLKTKQLNWSTHVNIRNWNLSGLPNFFEALSYANRFICHRSKHRLPAGFYPGLLRWEKFAPEFPISHLEMLSIALRFFTELYFSVKFVSL